MGYGLGVDLGTTWTAAAIMRDGGEPQIVALGTRSAAVPTVVALQQDGTFAVGDAGVRRASTEPERVVREFKRRIGDTVPVLIGGQPWSPESLLSAVLGWVLARVVQQEGGPPDDVVVTYPANWGPLRRELLEQAAVTAGGVRARFLTEPEAAAIHYAAAERIADGTIVAVYDFGGGTFDATVLRKEGDGFEILGRPEGVERLGGLDIDAALLAHVTAGLGDAWSGLDPDDPAARAAAARLRDDIVVAKEALSEDADVAIPVQLPGGSTEVRLTRGELEAMVAPMIERSADALAAAIEGAGLTPAHVDRILLVGGSSRIPLVSQVLSVRFGRPLALDTHPKHAVALGAARMTRLGGDDPVSATAAPVAAAVAPAWPAAAPTPVVEPTSAGASRRTPLLVAVGLGAVVVLIAAAVLLGGGGDGGDEVETADVTPAFCDGLEGFAGEIEDGALGDEDGLSGLSDTVDELGDAAESDEESATADALDEIVSDADPADPEATADDVDDEVGSLLEDCGLDELAAPAPASTSTTFGTAPPEAVALAGPFSLFATLAGCSDASCEPGSEVFIAPLETTCLIAECAVSIDGSPPATLTLDEDGSVVASGPARDGRGLQCQGGVDPTTFALRLDVQRDDTGLRSAAGELVFSVAEGDTACGARTRTYDVTVELTPGPASIAGTWSFDGAATECTGLSTADCDGFRASFTSNVDIECDASGACTARIATAEPAPFGAGAQQPPFTATGPLPDADGFSCDGGPDPTTWALSVDSIADGAGSWSGRVTLFSVDGSVDGNSCVEERVVAEGTATRG